MKITIYQMEQETIQFKQTHTINVSGKTKRNGAPAWFIEFEKKNDERWTRQEQINNSKPAWFIEFEKKNEERWAKQEAFNNSVKSWFIEFEKKQDARWAKQEAFNQMVLDQFKKHKWIK